jgi:hypothetical protein
VPAVRQETVLYPVILPVKGKRAPDEGIPHSEVAGARKADPPTGLPVPAKVNDLSEEDIRLLEASGGIEFTLGVRSALQRIAASWIIDDRVLQSPRPKEFRRRLTKSGKALGRAIALLDFNEGDAVDQQLHHWLINSGFRGAPDLLHFSVCMIDMGNRLIELLSLASRALPSDSGRRRPMDEERFIIYLADQFEASGGRALAYANKHKESGYADTSFCRFVHQFYALLPIVSKRSRSGLDEAIIRALKYRRGH